MLLLTVESSLRLIPSLLRVKVNNQLGPNLH